MYLDKLEIHGFKSFGDAVKLNIPQGITGVIGPNGSGKSNVADAIRWVLGEQSAKTLRGTKMEDIIFAGTEKRKSLGYAEVAMHIKNDDRKLPIDYEDVVIKRRVFRSGESEYLLNGSICRLKDIQELFMDTGVGREGYSIIGQGQIDKVLSSKPEDRRSLFEEAAGIYKYKVRRLEAERKLEKEKENLLRINDIIIEIESRLLPLEKESEKTKAYLVLKDQLKEREINLFITEVERIQSVLEKVKRDREIVDKQFEETISKKTSTLEIQTKQKEKREKLYESIQNILVKINDLEKKQQQQQSDIKLNEERILGIDTLMSQITKDTKKHEDQKIMMQNELQMLQSKKIGHDLEKQTQQEMLEKAERAFEKEQQDLTNLQKQVEGSKHNRYEKLREVDLLKSKVDKNKSLEEQLDYRYEQLKNNIAKMNSDVTHQETHLKVQVKQYENTKMQYEDAEKQYLQCDEEKKKLDLTIQEKQKKWQHTESTLQQTERQQNWLKQIKNDFEGYYQSVKQVLTLKKQEPSKWDGIIGITADLFKVPEKYETAIITSLGSTMQYIVTKNETAAKEMIQQMKQKGIGRVTFLPLDTIQSNPLNNELNALRQEDGFLGLGSELIGFEKQFQIVANYLLGRILIVDNMTNASKLAKKYRYKYKIVTLDGEVFNAGGSLSGGSAKNNKNNIFARSRELEQLYAKSTTLKEELEDLVAEQKRLETVQQNISVKWEEWRNKVEHLEEQQKKYILEINKLENSLEITKKSQLQLVEEKLQIQEVKEKSEQDRHTIYQEIEKLEDVITEDTEGLEALENQIDQLKIGYEEKQQLLMEQKIELSNTEQNIKHIIQMIEQAEKTIFEAKDQQLSSSDRQESLIRDKESIEKTIQQLQNTIKMIHTDIAKATENKESMENQRIVVEKEETEIAENIERIIETQGKLKEEQYRLTHKEEQLTMENQRQHDRIWEQYELTFASAEPFKKQLGEIADVKKEADTIRAKIKTLGTVNVNAVDEYEETKTRYDFLDKQRKDLEQAEETIRELIERLTVQMHEIFKIQFEAIAVNFTEVFKELFGGGIAFLQLVDQDNILESGIEIIAKPPGKKLQNMTLLSGGERTLTAIALLFGILKLKPSPFCVLDEIEAALDDANVLRFADYLSDLSKETQFVVITHRKGTMEKSDTLYGVTMQERGVSAVLSIQLEEATKYLDKKTS
ncbi:MAG: chromosome segregation protein SMC [Cellulosilyticaceae bacterium]